MLIDYGTHLEVLVANLLLTDESQRKELLLDAKLDRLYSFRCIVQLAHSAAPKAPSVVKAWSKRKGIQLTDELESYLDQLQRCATCYDYNDKTETYTFDFFVNEEMTSAVASFWKNALDLYSSLHKLSMLNDLAISRTTRRRFKEDAEKRRFASRLPEPQDEDKVFRFERVAFWSEIRQQIVDYVSLSDGEHQQAQILGTFSMISFPEVLFLLDEPESHFNPQWRVKFISKLLDMQTASGKRRDLSEASKQDALMTTHAPFVPSDMRRKNVLIFGKREASDKQTFWNEFFEVFGIRRKLVATFEEPVKKLSGDYGFVDLFWPGVLLVEHKSFGSNLSKAESQAFRYIRDLARLGRHDEIPRYIILSDFARIAIHDLEPEDQRDLPLFDRFRVATVEFPLMDFHRYIHAFAFIPGYKQHKFEEQDPINLKAVAIMGDLHDTMEAGGYRGHDLERFLVRILFCLFAEDTGIFERESFRLYLENKTAPDGSDLGMHLDRLFRVLDTPEEHRQKNLDEDLAQFRYVNGGLFAERLEYADLNRDMRNALLASTHFDWSRISPATRAMHLRARESTVCGEKRAECRTKGGHGHCLGKGEGSRSP